MDIKSADLVNILVILFFFGIEAITHWNIGKYGKIRFTIPPASDLFKIMVVVLFIAIISNITRNFILKEIGEGDPEGSCAGSSE